MARSEVVEISCDRCKRKEYVSRSEEKKEPDLTVHGMGRDIVLDDLCVACQKTVSNYIDGIGKEIKGRSPKRIAKKKGIPKDATSSDDARGRAPS